MDLLPDQIGQSYGRALPDQMDRLAGLFDAHLELIADVRDLYRDRAALERDYAAKLQLLVKKAADKKSKMEASIVVGEDPTKAWNANTLKQSSLHTAYDEILNSMVSTAQDHVNIADALTSQVVEVLRSVGKKNEESRKKEMQFFQKLLSDRDRVYTERLKCKQKYDEECNESESYRQKQSRAADDRQADRAAKQAETQRNDMLNSKNAYLISTAIANKSKARFYDENLPTLENQLQLIQRRLVERFTKILQHCQSLQLGHLDVLKSRIGGVEAALEGIDTAKDQDLFIEHNIRPFSAPADWGFEPCATHYDTSEMSIEPAPKIVLQNKLSKCRSNLQEVAPLIETKRRELDQFTLSLSAYTPDHTVGNIDEISDNYLDAQHHILLYTTSEQLLNAELETILASIGDDEGGQQPHSFKSSSFSIPTQCGYCKTSIWGLSKQGKTCKQCGLSVHSKCELKVPANCQKSEGRRSSSGLSKQGKSLSRTASQASSVSVQASAPSSFASSLASRSHEESRPAARVLFDFTATSEFELSVSEDATVHIVEPDDGSGWVKVVDDRGRSGLVPASYLESNAAFPPRASLSQGSSQYVRAIYSYDAQGDDELSFKEGESIELTSGPTGGRNYGDGWWEGFSSNGRKGIFPSNYVEMT